MNFRPPNLQKIQIVCSQTFLDEGFQKRLATSEPNEEGGSEFKTPNPRNGRKEEEETQLGKERLVPKNALLEIRTLSRTQF